MSLEELEELGGFADVMGSLPPELRADRAERATVASLARKLPGENAVRRTAERILRGTAGDSDHIGTVKQVVVERSGFKWRERILAAWSLGLTPARSPEEREDCLKALGNLANHSLERDNFGAFVRLQYRALILTIPYLVFIRFRGYDSYTFWDLVNTIFINLGFSLLALPVSMMLERRRMNLARAAAILSLGRMEAPEATGVVAAAVYDKVGEGSSDVKKAAERSLPAVLEALTDEHYGRVLTTSIEYLCRILQDKRDHLVLAALKALGKVGEARLNPWPSWRNGLGLPK